MSKVKAANKDKKNISLPLKKTAGRPPTYRHEYAQQAHVACAELGATDIKLAKLFGVSKVTINVWKREYPEFKKALVCGKDSFNTLTAEASLLKRVTGYHYTEKTMEPHQESGEMSVTKTVRKHIAPDPASISFFLKNRDPARWKETKNIDANIAGDVNHCIKVVFEDA